MSDQQDEQNQVEDSHHDSKKYKRTKQGKHVGRYFIFSNFGQAPFNSLYTVLVDDENDPEHGKKFLMKKYDKERVKKEQMTEQLKKEIVIQKQLFHSSGVDSRLTHVHVFGLDTLQTRKDIFCFAPFVAEKSQEFFETVVAKKKLEEKVARRYFRQMSIALRFCHANGVSHMDVKLENFIHDFTPSEDSLFLTDFGLSRGATKSTRLTESIGTPNFVAPEVLHADEFMAKKDREEKEKKKKEEQNPEEEEEEEEGEKKVAEEEKKETEKGQKEEAEKANFSSFDYSPFLADCYSLGVVLYVMVAGHLPFDDSSMAAMFKKIQRQEYKMSKQFSEQLSDLISHLICYEKDRYSTRDIILHPWFLSEDTEGEEGAFDFKRLLVARDTFTLWPTVRPLFQVAYKCRDSKSKLSSCLSSVYNIRHYCALFLPIVSSKESLKEIDR